MAGRDQQIHYYRPYDSADESGSDSETTTSTDSWFSYGMDQHPAPVGSNDGIPNFKAFASQQQLRDAAARNFSTVKDELKYGIDRLGKYTVFSQYDAPIPDLSGEDQYGKTRFATSDGNENSLVLVDSRYRDRTAYPQPTQFSLRLPRIYKNVTNITLSDVKLLTSFYFFRTSKGNTDITVYEKGRQTLTYEGDTVSTIVKRYIATGSYNIDSLQSEIQLQLNYTPLFFDFPNGFNDFIAQFRASGDYSINFNQPGEFFYNNTTNLWIPNPTVNTIVTHFWPSRFAGLTNYTVDQTLIAYYYPVLNEYLYDEEYSNTDLNLDVGIGLNPAVTTRQDVINWILYEFSGINPPDPIVFAVINANRSILDKYRLQHTFRYWLINKYVVGRDTRSQNVYITSPSLNTSLVNLLTQQRSRFFTKALQLYNLTPAQYSNITTSVDRSLAVLQDMYSFEQTRFLDSFAVPWSQYTLSYYAVLSNTFLIRNGLNAVGIPASDSEAVSAGIVSYSNNILTALSSNPPNYWPNLSSLGNLASTIYLENLSTATSSFTDVYCMQISSILENQPIIEPPNDYIYTDYLTASANAVCPVNPASYTTFAFKSPVRQTMQVETLPRPPIYRVPDYNLANFDSTINQYFDISYSNVFTSTYPYAPTVPGITYAFDNLQSSILQSTPGWMQPNVLDSDPNYSFGRSYQSSIAQFTTNLSADVFQPNRTLYTTFITPNYPSASANSNYVYDLNLSVVFYTNQTSLSTIAPNDTFRMFVYHDRGGFQGDVMSNRNENPKFFKYSTMITGPDVSGTISFRAYPNQQYYVNFRADNSNFGTAYVKIFPWFSSSFTSTIQTRSIAGINPATDIYQSNFQTTLVQSNWNYAQAYDSNWLRLPIDSNLWPPDPSEDPNNQYLTISTVAIGYDSNGVSTDYTDYIPYSFNNLQYTFSPNCNIGMDPTNYYLFQSNSPYNTSTMTFLYENGFNAIYSPALSNVYTPTTVATRQYKLAHYYSVNYIPEPIQNVPIPTSAYQSTIAQQPFTLSTTQGQAISSYTYAGQNSSIQLGRGVLGFSILPNEGVWDIKKLSFRSVIYDSNNDPNWNIEYIGVFNMIEVLSTPTKNLTLSSAYVVLSNESRNVFTPNTLTTSEQFGFDANGGTVYTFVKDTSYIAPTYSNLLGYTQLQNTMSDQPESMYCAIGFSVYGQPLTMKLLSGSVIPYPYYNNPIVSTAYLDGTRAYNSSFGVIFPSTIGPSNFPFVTNCNIFAPPSGGSPSQSQYIVSQPIGTSVLGYKEYTPFIQDPDFFYPWTTTLTPTNVFAGIANYVMIQDTNFAIYSYENEQLPRTLTTPAYTLTGDEIFPSEESTSLVGATANPTSYYFIGFSNYNNQSTIVRVKRFTPTDPLGPAAIETMNTNQAGGFSFAIPTGGTLKSVSITPQERVVLSYQETTGVTRLYTNSLAGFAGSLSAVGSIPTPSTMVHTMPLESESTVYLLPQNATTLAGNSVWKHTLGGSFPGTKYTATGSGIASAYTGFAAIDSNFIQETSDRLYLFTNEPSYQSTMFVTTSLQTGQMNISPMSSEIQSPVTNVSPAQFSGIWLTASNQPYVWANRNTDVDIAGIIQSAWQIFYPWQKVVLEKVANNYNAITDLTYLNYPEFPHVSMFFYSNYQTLSNDLGGRWGLERNSNFVAGDIDLAGYYFNSYIFNVPLTESSNLQYLAVRAYTPTEKFETMIRFVLPNKYDFGYVTQNDLINEISSLSNSANQYNSNYAFTLSNFNLSFQQSTSFFGGGLLPNFDGSNFDTSNFRGFASNVSTIYQGYQSNASLLSNITNFVNSNLLLYVSTNLQYIVPPSALTRQNFTDPIIFSLFWKSGLLPQYKNLLEDWGLGYNLGYAKLDTPFSTYHRATSFYKILEDYIYLRLNPEFQTNRMDTTFRENFKVTRDSTGAVQNFHGKLLLNNFNSFSSSFVFNNAPFNPPIGKLETMYFEWVNFVGETIDNNDCEWTATLVISENKSKATVASTTAALPPMAPLRK